MKAGLTKNNKTLKPAILGGRAMFSKPVPITKPTLPATYRLERRYKEIIKSRMITNAYNVAELEKEISRYLKVKHAIALSSCTSGLMLIIKALELRGEIILPSFTFHATAHAVVWNGLKPVFADCDPETYNIDPCSVERLITSDTSAIIGVHIFGNPANIKALESITKKHNLKLIFDSAHGFGTSYQGNRIGGFGDAESFSLSPTKLLTAGEGGVVATNNDTLANKIWMGRNYGDPGTYNCEFSGLSARMSEFNALLGIESLRDLEENVIRRNKLAERYRTLLSGIPGINFQKIEKGNRSTFKDFSILIKESQFVLDRDMLAKALQVENIAVKKYFYPPVHEQKAFSLFISGRNDLINTEQISKNSLSIPIYSDIPVETVEAICKAIYRIYLFRNEIANKFK